MCPKSLKNIVGAVTNSCTNLRKLTDSHASATFCEYCMHRI